MSKAKNIIRYIVNHSYRYYNKSEPQEVEVSYNTALDHGGFSFTAQSLAKHTASRYRGIITQEFEDGSKSVFKSYAAKAH